MCIDNNVLYVILYYYNNIIIIINTIGMDKKSDIRIGIVGSSFRTGFNKDRAVISYTKCIETIKEYILNIKAVLLDGQTITVISGVSVWGDYVPIYLFNNGYIDNLILYSPVEFNNGQFDISSYYGRVLNSTHSTFTKDVSVFIKDFNSFCDICHALKTGAKLIVPSDKPCDFKLCNDKISEKLDILISISESKHLNIPKTSSETRYIWDKCLLDTHDKHIFTFF